MDAADCKHVVLGLIFLKIHLGCVRGAACLPLSVNNHLNP